VGKIPKSFKGQCFPNPWCDEIFENSIVQSNFPANILLLPIFLPIFSVFIFYKFNINNFIGIFKLKIYLMQLSLFIIVFLV
jgi:hypothetical protein